MGDQENSIRITHSLKKRPIASTVAPTQSTLQKPSTKKRVPLVDLTNSADAGSTRKSGLVGTQKPKPNSKKAEKEPAGPKIVSGCDGEKFEDAALVYQYLQPLEESVSPKNVVSYDDRQKCEDAPLIYRNLRTLECQHHCKYEEISPPRVEDFCYITDNTYTKEEVVNMERDVLIFLNHDLGTPTIKTFMRIFTRGTQENCKVLNLELEEFLGSYLAEISLLDYECLQFLPSIVAASAIFLSRFTIKPTMHPWSLALQQYSGYRPSELKECVLAIQDLQLSRRGLALQAVRDKYMQHKFKGVAALSSPSEIPASYFEDCKA
ncbi:hypothetical protein RHGRI_032601 [Rhododendron griersonianum]|uniref:B-like cyclin n=1 Tax=Rhododendron griersonianum TaxID=479676 RepID=A0AAV6ID01_9ERIC|nr:hypothetical protein RHGRI_032601 [Rhododendron griersonianum]